ncbi:MAG TPA: SRPBCC family protein [Solirubrobacterales bacterium]|jgi:uncharacterized membrane protein|nr:SRPBCC family protein [Solirubrobacterales bacterium]
MAGTDIEKVTRGAKKAAKRVTDGDGPLKSPVGLAVAGAAVAAIPLAAEKLAKVAGPKVSEKANQVTDKAKSELRDTAKDALPDSPSELLGGGPLKRMFGGGGDSDDDSDDSGRAAPGFGSGRRMPIQQSIDVAVPLKDAYNHWTQFEDWPEFMHRIESAEQVDDATVSFQAKIWGITKRFEADIVEQRPDERIEWNVTEGYAHTGVVTFHPLSENLTRIDTSLDIQPSNLIDKASRGMRFAKRAVRGDLHRFKAYVELDKDDKDGWRGTIEDGKVKRKTERKSSRSSSDGRSRRSSGRGSNGSGPRSRTSRKSGSRG